MMESTPSRLALILLRRLARTDAPLAGDLVEMYGAGRSRRWLYAQLLTALAIRRRSAAFVPPPLGLAPPDWMPARRRPPGDIADAMAVNMTGSPVHGVGGLGLLALGVLVSVAQPLAWLFPLYAFSGGILLGAVMVVRTRRRPLQGPPVTVLELHGV
jgi:hypothetical protein